MPAHTIIKLQLAIRYAPHEINPPARTLILVARFDIRRTCRRTQPAVDAVQQQLIVERSAGIGM